VDPREARFHRWLNAHSTHGKILPGYGCKALNLRTVNIRGRRSEGERRLRWEGEQFWYSIGMAVGLEPNVFHRRAAAAVAAGQ
jgi:hypothetical protein